ncbi:glycosyltransferase [Agaribacter flavus]|uniref:Glycosyltransferase n=1 Tax=Agaribacter flavus TaxID=1902781 RepID=A0ABV7FU39_9ALTE
MKQIVNEQNVNETIVSFVIPHMGREEMLIETLQSIQNQDFDLNKIEVYVVTKNSHLQESVHSFAKVYRLNCVYVSQDKNISMQRNIGAENIEGQYIAFLDADVSLANNWLQAMLKKLRENRKIKLVSAIQKNSANAPPLEKLRTALSNAHVDCEVTFLPGRNLLLEKSTFHKSGGFPEHLETCEDYVFTHTISKQGILFYSADSHYVHIGEDKAFRPMAEKEVWRGLSNIASIRGRKIPLSEWPSFIVPPLFTLGVVCALLFTVFSHYTLAILSVLGAVTLLCLYSFRLASLTKGDPSIATVFKFYSVYFPARTWGTIKGLMQK